MRWIRSISNMRVYQPSRLVARMAAHVVLLSTALVIASTALDLFMGFRDDTRAIDAEIEQIRHSHLQSIAESVWVQDARQLEVLMLGVSAMPDIVMVQVRYKGVTQHQIGKPLIEAGIRQRFELSWQHRGEQQVIGELVVEGSYANAYERVLDRLWSSVFINAVNMVVLAALMVWSFYRLIGRHLVKMGRYAETYSEPSREGALVLDREEPERPDELSHLVQGINHLHRSWSSMAGQQEAHAQQLEEQLEERRIVEERLRIMAQVFQNSHEAILITDAYNNIVESNPAFHRLTGYSRAEVLGQNPRMLSAGMTPPEVYRTMWQSLADNGHWEGEIWDRRKDGRVYPKWLTIRAMKGEEGAVAYYVASFTDISERKEAQEKIFHLAHHDSLTGLSNRMSLEYKLKGVLTRGKKDQPIPVAVVFIDLDRFKDINDTYGHNIGDQLLVKAAQRLTSSVREQDIVARLGGDEFVVVLTTVPGPEIAMRVAEKIRRALEQPYAIDDKVLRSGASVGLAMFPEAGNTPELLMRNADAAMYHAKSLGRNNVQCYTEGLEQEKRERIQLANELVDAIERRQFELHYQPKFAARSGRLVGAEALLRWRHPEQGLVSPARFIPLAEETGQMIPLGEWVIDEACRQLRSWRDNGWAQEMGLAINLSAQQLGSDHLVSYVRDKLAQYGLAPRCLELELTESMLMENIDANTAKLQAMREMGLKLSIDDFGTGYSSLSYLKHLPVDALKLDRSFVRDIESDASNVAICISTIALAHNLGLQVVAEGVETEAQREFLIHSGCDFLQGYLLGKPMPAEQFGSQILTEKEKAP